MPESVDIIVKDTLNEGGFVSYKAQKVAFCTNSRISQMCPKDFKDYVPGRGQIIITEPIPDLKFKGTFHVDDGFYYFRTVGNRVLVGGGRNIDINAEETYELANTPLIMDSLYEYLNKLILPNTKFEVDISWAGTMGFWKDKKKDYLVKEVEPRVYAGVSCCGMGVAMTN